jgi:hypothetical protein
MVQAGELLGKFDHLSFEPQQIRVVGPCLASGDMRKMPETRNEHGEFGSYRRYRLREFNEIGRTVENQLIG